MRKLNLLGLLLLTANFAKAQEKTSATTSFQFSADAYYKYDFSNQINYGTSFTNSNNSFELGMASIKASHQFEKASVLADVGFGSRASQFTYNDDADTFMIKQLYFSYEVNKNWKVYLGSFSTHIGYEMVDAVDNKNYSMSYAFSYGPFFNTGLKTTYSLSNWSFMFGITNPTDFKTALKSGTNQKTYIGQIACTNTNNAFYFNFTSGSNNPVSDLNRTQWDLVYTQKINPKWAIAANATLALDKPDFGGESTKWYSLVGYSQHFLNPKTTLAYRLEYFNDNDGIAHFGGFQGANVLANTLSLSYKTGNLSIIPEIRLENANKDVFLKSDNSASATNFSLLLATTYAF